MNSSQVFRNCYIKLYKELRKYLWDVDTVMVIAELEVATYKTFPEVLVIESLLKTLRRHVFDVLRDDECLSKALNLFDSEVADNQNIVLFIKKFKGVNPI